LLFAHILFKIILQATNQFSDKKMNNNRKKNTCDADKAARLAEALRQNLQKRKMQARARRKGSHITGTNNSDSDIKKGT
jgi:2'-5' RNA ligase